MRSEAHDMGSGGASQRPYNGFEVRYVVVVARMRLDAARSTRTQQHSERGPQPGCARRGDSSHGQEGEASTTPTTSSAPLTTAARRPACPQGPFGCFDRSRQRSPATTQASSNSDPASGRSPRGQPLPFRRFPRSTRVFRQCSKAPVGLTCLSGVIVVRYS